MDAGVTGNDAIGAAELHAAATTTEHRAAIRSEMGIGGEVGGLGFRL
jgi:hypothetical protein